MILVRVMYIVPGTTNLHKKSNDDDFGETENYLGGNLWSILRTVYYLSVFMTVQPSKTRIFGPSSQFPEAKIICVENSSTWRNPRAMYEYIYRLVQA